MSRKNSKKSDAVVEVIQVVFSDLGIDDVQHNVENTLEARFGVHYNTKGQVIDAKEAIADARSFQDITTKDVLEHPEFKQMMVQLAKDIARGARKQSLQFQLSLIFDE